MDALPAELTEKAARSHAGVGSIGKTLGRWLSNRDGRWSGDLTVRRAGMDSHTKATLWKIQNTASGRCE
ncbi:MAG: hypothetical protein H0V41_10610 [Pseudonocardiales bacterium]|nr:hypothetical protein [Pseudonocardiales bacterium]